MNLNPQDFIKMMITQLQNQDPLQPMQSSEILSQMSQIGQLQSSTTLQTAINGLMLQNQIGSGSNLMGKSVTGLDDDNKNVSGVVKSISVVDKNVYLQLDSGSSLQLGRVTAVTTPPSAGAAAASTTGGIATTATSTTTG